MNRRFAIVLAATCLIWIVASSGAQAVRPFESAAAFVPDATIEFCPDAFPPDATDPVDPFLAPVPFSDAKGKSRIQDAIAEWNSVLGARGGGALTLTYDPSCDGSSGEVTITAAAHNNVGLAFLGDRIEMSTSVVWEDDSHAPLNPSHYSYEGVLVHEMGHMIGLAHVGGKKWSPNDDALPTMTDAGQPGSGSWTVHNLSDDDRGGAVWVEGVGPDMWNADPGFESFSAYWTKIGNTATGTAGVLTGNYGAKLPAAGDGIMTSAAIDSWGQFHDRQHSDNTINARAQYRNNSSGTGSLDVSMRSRVITYDDFNDVDGSGTLTFGDTAIGKYEGGFDVGAWTSWTVVTGGSPCTATVVWTQCKGANYSVTPGSGVLNGIGFVQMHQVEVKFVNGSTTKMYLDEAGIFGGFVR